MVLMNVQGAFDVLLSRRLFQRMRKQGWYVNLIRLVTCFFNGRKIRARFDGETVEPTDLEYGTP